MSPRLGFFLSAVLGVLSFPPIGLWPLAYVAMVPFLLSCRVVSPRRALLWGYLSGFVFFAGVLYWVGLNSGAPPLLSAFSAFMLVLIFSSIWALHGMGRLPCRAPPQCGVDRRVFRQHLYFLGSFLGHR